MHHKKSKKYGEGVKEFSAMEGLLKNVVPVWKKGQNVL